jgi:hypothetical protein
VRAFEGLVAKWMTIGIVGVVVARLCRSEGLLLQKCAAASERASWAGLPCARSRPVLGWMAARGRAPLGRAGLGSRWAEGLPSALFHSKAIF